MIAGNVVAGVLGRNVLDKIHRIFRWQDIIENITTGELHPAVLRQWQESFSLSIVITRSANR